jgi:hypothetical protein
MRLALRTVLMLAASTAVAAPAFALPTVAEGYDVEVYASIGYPLSLAVAEDGTLYVGSYPGTIYSVPEGGAPEGFTATSFATGLSWPEGLALGQGDWTDFLYVSDGNGGVSGRGRVMSVGETGGAASSVWSPNYSGWTWPFDLAIDPSGLFGGDLFQVDSGGPDSVLRVTAPGAGYAWVTVPENLSALEFSHYDIGSAYPFGLYTFHEHNGYGIGSIRRYNPDRSYDTFAYLGTDVADGVFGYPGSAFGDLLYVSNSSQKNLQIVDPNGVIETFATGFTFGYTWITGSMAFSPDGDSLYVADYGAHTVYRIFSQFVDTDGDGVADEDDVCPGGNDLVDTDADTIPDFCDGCPEDAGNDLDDDGICYLDDNCPDLPNADQLDADADGAGDLCDDDDDNDGVLDVDDNCAWDANADQADADGDGAGDVCDDDYDGDGVLDAYDACLPTATGAVVDGDGCSIDQLCPCDNPWKNHGKYVSCVAHTAEDFVDAGLITDEEKDAIMSGAGGSDCGHK